MKKALVFIGLLIYLNSFGQEIKIKKDKISLDGVEVAMLVKNKLVYTFTTLDNVPKFSVEKKATALDDGSLVYWCILTDLNTNKTNEIIDYGSDQGLSFQRGIVASVVNEKYKFLTSTGIDEKAISEFINGASTNLQKTFDDANLKYAETVQKEEEMMVKLKITIKDGKIYQNQEMVGANNTTVFNDVLIGTISSDNIVYVAGFPSSLVYTINSSYIDKEINGNQKEFVRSTLLANWYDTKTGYTNPVTGKNFKQQILTADGKSFNLKKIADSNVLSRQIVAKLLYNGYTFGKMVKLNS